MPCIELSETAQMRTDILQREFHRQTGQLALLKPPMTSFAIDNQGNREYNFRKLVPEIPSTTYLTHGIHAYPAKFIPHIPRYLIRCFAPKKGVVLDPFCGSGTALAEASILGRDAIGIELTPLGRLISRVKTMHSSIPNKMAVHFVEEVLNGASQKLEPDIPLIPNMDHWFTPSIQKQLGKLRRLLLLRESDFPRPLRDVFWLAFSSCVRRVCLADPKISKPFLSRHMREKIKNGLSFPKVGQLFSDQCKGILFRVDAFRQRVLETNSGSVPHIQISTGDARSLPKDLFVDFVVTSPPYANAQEYIRSIKMEMFWLGMADPFEIQRLNRELVGTEKVPLKDCSTVPSSHHRDLNDVLERIFERDPRRSCVVAKYFLDMRQAMSEIFRVLRVGGRFCLLVGDNLIRKVPVETHKILSDFGQEIGFRLEITGYDRIKARSLSPVRHETAGLIEVEWILVFKKPQQ